MKPELALPFPKTLTNREAIRMVNEDHLDGWQHVEFEDPMRIHECGDFILRLIDVPPGLEYCAGVGHHPPVVAEYRALDTPTPPPFFDTGGRVIDGHHRLAANKGRMLAVYVPSSYHGPLFIGNKGVAVSFR